VLRRREKIENRQKRRENPLMPTQVARSMSRQNRQEREPIEGPLRRRNVQNLKLVDETTRQPVPPPSPFRLRNETCRSREPLTNSLPPLHHTYVH
jgi:hypothetical protein